MVGEILISIPYSFGAEGHIAGWAYMVMLEEWEIKTLMAKRSFVDIENRGANRPTISNAQ
jgi:hypothetical protein